MIFIWMNFKSLPGENFLQQKKTSDPWKPNEMPGVHIYVNSLSKLNPSTVCISIA